TVRIVPLVNEGAADAKASKPAPAVGPGEDLAWNRSDARTAVASWTAQNSFRFRISASDKDNFTNAGLEEYEIVVKPDQLPTVIIEAPRRNVERTPEGYLPLQVLAEDDFGIASLKLIVDRIADASANATPAQPGAQPAPAPVNRQKHWELDLKNWQRIEGTGERQRFRLNWDWELKQVLGDVKAGDVLEYYLQVQDNYRIDTPAPGANVNKTLVHPPQVSSKLRINIISQEQ